MAFTGFLLAMFSTSRTLSAEKSRIGSCIVLGLENKVDDERWNDRRIGMGLAIRLAEKVFDTGLFQVIEEDPRQRAELEELRNALWGQRRSCSQSCLQEEADRLGVTFTLAGRVTDFKTSRSKAFIGPMSTVNLKSTVYIELSLYSSKHQAVLSCEGKGSAATRAGGVIFEFSGGGVMFDRSAVGPATEEALDEAIQCLLKQMKKKKWL